MGTKHTSECLKNAASDELIFVLRAQDASSPKTILHWIAENLETCPEFKLREAFDQAMAMRYYPGRKKAD